MSEPHSLPALFFSNYLSKEDEILKEYIAQSFDRLKEGHIATSVELEDIDNLKES